MAYKLIMSVSEMEENTEKWLELRRLGIGGSEVGIILGYSPFSNIHKLWLQKTDPTYYEEISEELEERFYFGHAMEQVIADAFEKRTGLKLKKQGMIQRTDKPYMFANVDRVIVGTDKEGKKGFLECKNVSSWGAEAWEGDEIPSSYYLQCQWYMSCGDYDYCYIAALIGGNHLVYKRIERNEEDIALMEEAVDKFWNENVLGGKMPPIDGSEDCAKTLMRKYPNSDGEEIELDGKWDMLLSDRDKYKAEIKKLEATIDEIDNKLREMMGNAPKAEGDLHRVSYLATVRTGFDKKQLEKDYPKIYEKYVTKTPTRGLRIMTKKSKLKKD